MIIQANRKHYPAIVELWEQSVRATHAFLPEDYLQYIKQLLPIILPDVSVYVYENNGDTISAFLGVAEKKIEMLFIHPVEIGKGIGRGLVEFAVNQLGARKVDVNEDNTEAVKFYRHLGFVQTGRSETDGLGKPYPLLHMDLAHGLRAKQAPNL
jgi:putative acetyltransferase